MINEKEIQAIGTEMKEKVEKLDYALEIKNDEDATKASKIVANLKTIRNEAEARRKEIKKPILEAGKEIDRLFTEMLQPTNAVYDGLNARLNGYLTEKRQKEQEEMQRIQEEERKKMEQIEADKRMKDETKAERKEQVEVETAVKVQSAAKPKTNMVGLKERTVKEYDITDKRKAVESLLANDRLDGIEIKMSVVRECYKAGVKLDGVEEREEIRTSL